MGEVDKFERDLTLERVGEFKLARDLRILKVKDLNGDELYIPDFAGSLEQHLKDFNDSMPASMAKSWEFLRSLDSVQLYPEILSVEMKEKLSRGFALGLPSLLTLHLVLNHSGHKLEDFSLPKDGKKTVGLSFSGKAGVGKSLMAVSISLMNGLSVFSLDSFSSKNAGTYESILEKGGVGLSTSIKEIMEVITVRREEFQSTIKTEKRPIKSMGELLDDVLGKFKDPDFRPEVVIFDMPGSPAFQGEQNGHYLFSREANIYDRVGITSMEGGAVWTDRRIMLPELFERKLVWIRGLIAENKKEWLEKRDKLARAISGHPS